MSIFRTGRVFLVPLLASLGFTTGVNAADGLVGDIDAGKEKSSTCVACHSADGNSVVAIWPKLAGQKVNYLRKQIRAFRDGEREDPSMQPMVANLSDQDIADLAAYFASQKVTTGEADPELVQLGALVYRGGNFDSSVPACMGCHLPDGSGNNPAGWPSLKGQHAEYVEKQLRAYAEGSRTSDPKSMMREIAQRLTEQEIAAVAQFVSGLH